ncbi:MAG: hypothetical protein H0T46_05725 [Deltaproteobacteria bacterium]|nr:hypothetical protein [Deltaproteobacteria bacterium]
MRSVLFAAITLTSVSVASAEGPAYQVFEDSALGITLPPKKILLGDKGMDATLTDCIVRAPAAAGSVLYWLEIGKAGNVTAAKVRGTGSSALDSCIAGGLKKASITEKLPSSIVVVGRVDVLDRNKNKGTFLPSPKVSEVAVLLDAKGGAWQLGTKRLAYTENRAADISAALDTQVANLNACAAKRAATGVDLDLVAWVDGSKSIVRGTGDTAYDNCLAKALAAIKLPTGASAIWMELMLKKAAEPLQPRTDKPSLSKEQGLKDALTTAVRARSASLLDCTDGKKAKLAKLTVVLSGGKANVKAVSTGDPAADACVKTKFVDVTIKSAEPTDKLELEVELAAQ